MLKLVKPSKSYLSKIEKLKAEYIKYGSSFDGTNSLNNFDDLNAWMNYSIALESYETMPEEYKSRLVPALTYLVVREEDDEVVGLFNCRLELNDFLKEVGGNIGYSIRPLERKQGYAKQALRLVLDKYIELGFTKVLITCHKNNEASRRTILSCGGVFDGESVLKENEIIERYYVPLKFSVDKDYTVVRFLGKGKDGYSYVVKDNKDNLYTLKKMHYEKSTINAKGKKIQNEINSYNRILLLGIRMPKLVYVDIDEEIIIKEYIDGPTIQELIDEGACINRYIPLVEEFDNIACKNWLTLSYLPANFVVYNDLLYYIDYECNVYSDDNNFENWGIDSWKKSD